MTDDNAEIGRLMQALPRRVSVLRTPLLGWQVHVLKTDGNGKRDWWALGGFEDDLLGTLQATHEWLEEHPEPIGG